MINIEPIYAVAESHSSRRMKNGKEVWGYSFHIVIQNIIAIKSVQKMLVEKINSLITKNDQKRGYSPITGPDKFSDYNIDVIKSNALDDSVYKKGIQKLRSVYSSKDGETRPFNLLEGTFNDMVITRFIDENATHYSPILEVTPKTQTQKALTTDKNEKDFLIEKYNDYAGIVDVSVFAKSYEMFFKFLRASSNIGIPLETFDDIVNKANAGEYNKENNKKMYDEPHNEAKGKIGWRFIYNFASESNPEQKEILDAKYKAIERVKKNDLKKEENKKNNAIKEKEWNDSNPNSSFKYMIAHTDKDAGNAVFEHLKNRLVFCEGQTFYKHHNIWIHDMDIIQASLHVFVLDLPIFKELESGSVVFFAGDLSNAKKIVEIVLHKTKVNRLDNAFYNKFHSTTKGKIAFVDGVLDFQKKVFHLWEDIDFEYYSTLMINRSFAEVFKDRSSNANIKDVKEKVFDQLFEGDCTLALEFLARGVAGHFEDKHWGRYMGNRDCGKGVFGELNQTALEKYVTTIEAGHFLSESRTGDGDQAKKNSWMVPLQFVRLALTQEMKFDNENRNLKIDGVTIKKFSGGGDKIEARQNHRDEIYINLDCRLIIMCNDMPQIRPTDTLESCVSFQSTKQFKSQKWIDAEEKMMLEQGDIKTWMLERSKYKVGNNNIKTLCQTVEWADAYILLMIDNYKDAPVVSNTSFGDDDDDVNLKRLILQNFVFNKNSGSDFTTNQSIKEWIQKLRLNVSIAKIKAELITEGCRAKKNNQNLHGFIGVKLIQKVEDNCESKF
jgi:hypothetical protein